MPVTDVVKTLYTTCTKEDGDVEYNGLWMHKFDRARLESSKSDIEHQIRSLTLPNMWTNLCMDRADNQWGEQRDIELLVALGVAAGVIEEIARNPGDATLRAFDTLPLTEV